MLLSRNVVSSAGATGDAGDTGHRPTGSAESEVSSRPLLCGLLPRLTIT